MMVNLVKKWQDFSKFSSDHGAFIEPTGGGPRARRLFRVIHGHDPNDNLTIWLDRGVIVIVLLSVFMDTFIAHHFTAVSVQFVVNGLDWLATLLLTAEFLTKVALVGLDSRLKHMRFKRLRFALRPLSIVDLVVLIPSWLSLILTVDLGIVRLIRLLRLLEVLHWFLPKWNSFLRETEGQTFRRRTYEALFGNSSHFGVPALIDLIILATILISVVTITLESVASLRTIYESEFHFIESFVTLIFLIEYIARLYACVEHPDFKRYFRGRLRYAITWAALIDLVAILPLMLSVFFAADVKVLWVVRLLRILKLSRYSNSFASIFAVVREDKAILLSAFVMLSLVTTFAAFGAYIAESSAQPEKFSSIPAAMYWAIVTLTTIGYGDVYPITIVGQAMTMLLAIAGLGMIALPAGILAKGFSRKIQEPTKPKRFDNSQDVVSGQNKEIEAGGRQKSDLTMDQVLRSQHSQERLAAIISTLSRPEREAMLALLAISLSEPDDR
jgi:voltage-gated potassium channel